MRIRILISSILVKLHKLVHKVVLVFYYIRFYFYVLVFRWWIYLIWELLYNLTQNVHHRENALRIKSRIRWNRRKYGAMIPSQRSSVKSTVTPEHRIVCGADSRGVNWLALQLYNGSLTPAGSCLWREETGETDSEKHPSYITKRTREPKLSILGKKPKSSLLPCLDTRQKENNHRRWKWVST